MMTVNSQLTTCEPPATSPCPIRAHVLQHVPFEGLGSMAGWLDARGAHVGWTRFFAGDPLPSADAFDLLIALGGPMSMNDEAGLAWLRPEKELVRDAFARGLPVLGVCLGAQLIASALGARVYGGRFKEIGWFPVDAVPADDPALDLRQPTTVFHWHGETFDLPDGAVRLARSAACENQAFQLGRKVVGLQFHLETTPAALDAIVEGCRNELVPGSYVQTELELRAAPAARYDAINRLMTGVLDHLVPAR